MTCPAAKAPITPASEGPDPYYGDGRGFDAVFDLCDRATGAFVEKLAHAASG